MAPLPCSPVSHSAASTSRDTTDDDSDESLTTTPRPGPSDPSQRSEGQLSKPSIPVSGQPATAAAPTSSKRDTPYDTQTEGHPRSPFTYAGRPSSDSRKSVSFTSNTSLPKPGPQGSYYGMSASSKRMHFPAVSPHRVAGNGEIGGGGESSADESTAIMRRNRQGQSYGGTAQDDGGEHATDGAADGEYVGLPKKRRGPPKRTRSGGAGVGGESAAQNEEGGEAEKEQDSWWRRLADKYGSVELENKGSVARDHLALGMLSPPPIHPSIWAPSNTDRANLPRLAPHLPLLRLHWRRRYAAVPPQHIPSAQPTRRCIFVASIFAIRSATIITRAAHRSRRRLRLRHAQATTRGQASRSDLLGSL